LVYIPQYTCSIVCVTGARMCWTVFTKDDDSCFQTNRLKLYGPWSHLRELPSQLLHRDYPSKGQEEPTSLCDHEIHRAFLASLGLPAHQDVVVNYF